MVSIMKTLRDPQDLPLFEPKMTRSRLKTVKQEKFSNWRPLAGTASKPPQFVDIDLEEDEDSSDEEYCPDEDEETLLSPLRMHLASQHNALLEQKTQSDLQGRGLSEKWSFMEKLDAVESEMDCSLNYEQPGDRPSDGDDDDDEGCLALRTRSRLHLEDVPLDQLEAELVSDDITDVCEGSFDQEDDRQWMLWLQSLLHPDCQDELDEEDDPEYDFVEDLTEPDLEDYRTDRGVQITRREVNKLLEELFDTLQEEEEEEEEAADKSHPQALQSEVLVHRILTEQQRTDQNQNKCSRQRRVLQDTTNHLHTTAHDLSSMSVSSWKLDHNQKLQLQEQIQQHVQLLTEVHLLSRDVPALSLQARITKHHLEDLHHRASVSSSLSVCNLKASLDLLQEVDGHDQPAAASHSHRLLPTMAASTNSRAFPLLPAHTAWLFATRPEFLYIELLPVCSLNPDHHQRPTRSVFTAGEEGLTVLGLKHFQGSVQPEELMCSFLLCQSVSAVRKHIRERIGPKAEPENILKKFLMEDVTPPLPLACSRVHSDDQRPPVDRNSPNMPTWLQNSQHVIRRTRSASLRYPSQLPPGCSLRLHPYWLKRSVRYRPRTHKRLFPLAHNDCLLPLAKASAGNKPISSQPLAPLTVCPAVPLATVIPDSSPFICGDIIRSSLPIGSNLLPQNFSNLLMPCSVAPPAYLLLQVTVTPSTPSNTESPGGRANEGGEGEGGASECSGGKRGASEGGGGEGGASDGGGGKGGASEGGGGEGGASEGGDGGASDGGGGEGGRSGGDGGGAMDERSGEGDEEDEEEEEDFDELTQDEDEEEELSSEESVLSVPELQDTMKQLTWLAAERRLCEDGDSEDDQSLMSQEDEEEDDDDEDEDEEQKESSEGGRVKDELLSGETASTGGPSGAGRGRGRRRPLRGLARARQRPVETSSKLLQLLDQNLVENDPLRESKDAAFAQSYLSRVREALQDSPGQMEQFVSVLSEFGDVKDEDRVLVLFRKLRCILSTRSDLLRDFSAFLHPEQALQCGLWEEQQAFERSRRFLRQLEISFMDNPSHYQKIIRALQTKADLSPHSVSELKAQMETLLKGHGHLQAEFWVFFDELRPLPARFSQFEEADWPGGGGEGGARGSFEEVISPEEEEQGLKHRPITSRRQRKMDANFKGCDWSSKPWPRLCPDVKLHSHRRKGDLGCHGNQVPGGGDTHRLHSLYEHTGPAHQEVELMSEWAECELSGQMRSGDEGYEEEENPTMKRRREESELPVPAHNVSLTASGEKKILWNREADRVILTMCQQEGANHSTFQAVSERLGNKTPSEVSGRFEDLMKLFRTAHTEAPPTDPDQSEEVSLSSQS